MKKLSVYIEYFYGMSHSGSVESAETHEFNLTEKLLQLIESNDGKVNAETLEDEMPSLWERIDEETISDNYSELVLDGFLNHYFEIDETKAMQKELHSGAFVPEYSFKEFLVDFEYADESILNDDALVDSELEAKYRDEYETSDPLIEEWEEKRFNYSELETYSKGRINELVDLFEIDTCDMCASAERANYDYCITPEDITDAED